MTRYKNINFHAHPRAEINLFLAKIRQIPGLERPAKQIPEGTWKELPERGVICIDTGCGKGGRLTGMVIEDGKFILQSAGEEG